MLRTSKRETAKDLRNHNNFSGARLSTRKGDFPLLFLGRGVIPFFQKKFILGVFTEAWEGKMKQNENFLRADEVKPGFEMEFTYLGKDLRKSKAGLEYPMWQLRDDTGNLWSTSEWAVYGDGKENTKDPVKGDRITLRKSPVAKKFLLSFGIVEEKV